MDAVFSPDGQWVAYASGPGMTATTIYVRRYPFTDAQWELVAIPDGVPHHPVWSPDGTEITYNARAGSLDTVKVATTPTFSFGARSRQPRRVSTGPPTTRRRYDMLSDGRMLGLVAPGDAELSGAKINVALNWIDQLHALVPASRK
jgi:hypothetical protein